MSSNKNKFPQWNWTRTLKELAKGERDAFICGAIRYHLEEHAAGCTSPDVMARHLALEQLAQQLEYSTDEEVEWAIQMLLQMVRAGYSRCLAIVSIDGQAHVLPMVSAAVAQAGYLNALEQLHRGLGRQRPVLSATILDCVRMVGDMQELAGSCGGLLVARSLGRACMALPFKVAPPKLSLDMVRLAELAAACEFSMRMLEDVEFTIELASSLRAQFLDSGYASTAIRLVHGLALALQAGAGEAHFCCRQDTMQRRLLRMLYAITETLSLVFASLDIAGQTDSRPLIAFWRTRVEGCLASELLRPAYTFLTDCLQENGPLHGDSLARGYALASLHNLTAPMLDRLSPAVLAGAATPAPKALQDQYDFGRELLAGGYSGWAADMNGLTVAHKSLGAAGSLLAPFMLLTVPDNPGKDVHELLGLTGEFEVEIVRNKPVLQEDPHNVGRDMSDWCYGCNHDDRESGLPFEWIKRRAATSAGPLAQGSRAAAASRPAGTPPPQEPVPRLQLRSFLTTLRPASDAPGSAPGAQPVALAGSVIKPAAAAPGALARCGSGTPPRSPRKPAHGSGMLPLPESGALGSPRGAQPAALAGSIIKPAAALPGALARCGSGTPPRSPRKPVPGSGLLPLPELAALGSPRGAQPAALAGSIIKPAAAAPGALARCGSGTPPRSPRKPAPGSGLLALPARSPGRGAAAPAAPVTAAVSTAAATATAASSATEGGSPSRTGSCTAASARTSTTAACSTAAVSHSTAAASHSTAAASHSTAAAPHRPVSRSTPDASHGTGAACHSTAGSAAAAPSAAATPSTQGASHTAMDAPSAAAAGSTAATPSTPGASHTATDAPSAAAGASTATPNGTAGASCTATDTPSAAATSSTAGAPPTTAGSSRRAAVAASGAAITGTAGATAANPGASGVARTDDPLLERVDSGPLCAWCGAGAAGGHKLKRCAGCEEVRYCGPSCQKAHWKCGHKAVCAAAAAMNAALSRPFMGL